LPNKKSKSVKKLSFLDALKFINTHWYWLVIAMIAGGLLGWGATLFKTPVYEADAVFTVGIDYTQTGALTDGEEDQAMRGVGDIIFSDEVVSATLATLKDEGMNLSRDEFFDDAIFDREEFRWAIRYRDATRRWRSRWSPPGSRMPIKSCRILWNTLAKLPLIKRC
jgi:hypothetical protein